jgi:hypothetical protein
MKKYYIYHIPTFVHKDGKIGKIGCSEEPDTRTNNQGYTEYEILEEHTDIMITSDREIELQKQYGYPVDKVPYYMSRQKWGSVAGKKGGQKCLETGQVYEALAMVDRKKIHQTLLKNGFYTEFYKKGNAATIKSVLQYTKDGQFIAEHKSVSEAARSVGKDGASAISSVCKGKKPSIYGYVWKHKPTSI